MSDRVGPRHAPAGSRLTLSGAVAWPEVGPDARAMCAASASTAFAAWSPFVRAGVIYRILANGPGSAATARQVAERFDRYSGSLAAARVSGVRPAARRGPADRARALAGALER
jgi:hypothetical protein